MFPILMTKFLASFFLEGYCDNYKRINGPVEKYGPGVIDGAIKRKEFLNGSYNQVFSVLHEHLVWRI